MNEKQNRINMKILDPLNWSQMFDREFYLIAHVKVQFNQWFEAGMEWGSNVWCFVYVAQQKTCLEVWR